MGIDIPAADVQMFAPEITEEQAVVLIAGTIARAALQAPGIMAADFPNAVAAQDIIRIAVLRSWRASGGTVTTETVGPFSMTVDSRSSVDGLFHLSELAELQQMCRAAGAASTASPVFTMPAAPPCWPDPAERRRRR